MLRKDVFRKCYMYEIFDALYHFFGSRDLKNLSDDNAEMIYNWIVSNRMPKELDKCNQLQRREGDSDGVK